MNDCEEPTSRVVALPAANRAELAEIIIQSLDEQDDHEITSAWMAEILRRDEEIRSGAPVTRPAEDVLREARALIRCRG